MVFPIISEAADHYVSPAGSATWAESTNISMPTSIAIAMQNAEAGDTVFFRSGIYPGGEAPSYDRGYYEPSNAGTVNNPISFKAYPGEIPIIELTFPDPNQKEDYAIGNNFKDYIIWDGFILRATGGDTAGFYMGGADNSNRAVGCIMKNIDIIAGVNELLITDNHDCSRVNYTSHCSIINCKIGNVHTASYSDNNAALKLYHNDHLTIEHCEFYDSPNGISSKSDLDDSIIRYNYFHGNYKSIRVNVYDSSSPQSSDHNTVHNNVFAPSHMPVHIYSQEETAHANTWQFYHNTLYCDSVSDKLAFGNAQSTGWKVHSNIINGTKQISTNKVAHIAECDHNSFYTPVNIEMRKYGSNPVTYTSLASWQASGELESAWDSGCGVSNNPGCGSINSDPGFINASGNMNHLDDFRLSADSPCKGAGRNGVDMGADISQVGAGSQSPTGVPGAPPWFIK